MVRIRKTILASGLVALAAAGTASASPEISRGDVMASTCYACHGTDGKSPGSIPSLHGLPKEKIVSDLKAFKSGDRMSTVMERHAKGYSDAEIEELAEVISASGQ
ncbi:MAG: c-type cytochrome [Pseudomonadota bacterium]